MPRPTKPLVAVSACIRDINGAAFHAVSDRYLRAIAIAADAVPILVPALGDLVDVDHFADRFDGVVFTGSPSNVEPHHYDEGESRPGTWHDPRRDATTLPLLRTLIDADVPILAICRGLQELNVARGGSLHQHVQELPGKRDHRALSRDLPIPVRYLPEHHTVLLQSGGVLERLAGRPEVHVNSLHQQAINRLGTGFAIEATTHDGLIEGIRIPDRHFVLGVQWHPEACIDYDPFSRAIFEEFGRALRSR